MLRSYLFILLAGGYWLVFSLGAHCRPFYFPRVVHTWIYSLVSWRRTHLLVWTIWLVFPSFFLLNNFSSVKPFLVSLLSLARAVRVDITFVHLHCFNSFIGYFSPFQLYFPDCLFGVFVLYFRFYVAYLLFLPSSWTLWSTSDSSLSLRYLSSPFSVGMLQLMPPGVVGFVPMYTIVDLWCLTSFPLFLWLCYLFLPILSITTIFHNLTLDMWRKSSF